MIHTDFELLPIHSGGYVQMCTTELLASQWQGASDVIRGLFPPMDLGGGAWFLCHALYPLGTLDTAFLNMEGILQSFHLTLLTYQWETKTILYPRMGSPATLWSCCLISTFQSTIKLSVAWKHNLNKLAILFVLLRVPFLFQDNSMFDIVNLFMRQLLNPCYLEALLQGFIEVMCNVCKSCCTCIFFFTPILKISKYYINKSIQNKNPRNASHIIWVKTML